MCLFSNQLEPLPRSTCPVVSFRTHTTPCHVIARGRFRRKIKLSHFLPIASSILTHLTSCFEICRQPFCRLPVQLFPSAPLVNNSPTRPPLEGRLHRGTVLLTRCQCQCLPTLTGAGADTDFIDFNSADPIPPDPQQSNAVPNCVSTCRPSVPVRPVRPVQSDCLKTSCCIAAYLQVSACCAVRSLKSMNALSPS